MSAYSVFNHRHTGEILEQLGILPEQLIFTPHLLPIPRGILSTIYVRLNSASTGEAIEACMKKFYADSAFVRVFPAGKLPQIQYSLHTNYCDIGFTLAQDGKRHGDHLLPRQPGKRRGGAGCAEHESNVWLE